MREKEVIQTPKMHLNLHSQCKLLEKKNKTKHTHLQNEKQFKHRVKNCEHNRSWNDLRTKSYSSFLIHSILLMIFCPSKRNFTERQRRRRGLLKKSCSTSVPWCPLSSVHCRREGRNRVTVRWRCVQRQIGKQNRTRTKEKKGMAKAREFERHDSPLSWCSGEGKESRAMVPKLKTTVYSCIAKLAY